MIVLVGERPRVPFPVTGPWQSAREALEWGAFSSGLSSRKLKAYGLKWNKSLFLWPGKSQDMGEAREVFGDLIDELGNEKDVCIVLCGKKAAAAAHIQQLWPIGHDDGGSIHYAVLPHPSGRCQWWNDDKNKVAARQMLRGLTRRYHV